MISYLKNMPMRTRPVSSEQVAGFYQQNSQSMFSANTIGFGNTATHPSISS